MTNPTGVKVMPGKPTSGVGGELIKLAATQISQEKKLEIKREYGEKLNKIFSNSDLLETCFCLFENDLNVSETARKLYMHRNTLIYRIEAIKKASGLDLRKFSDAVNFNIIYAIISGDKK